MEHLLHENVCTSVSVFCGKASFISKQPDQSGQGVQNYQLVERRTQLHVPLAGSRSGVSPVPPDRQAPAQFPLQAEPKKVGLKKPMTSSLSKHTYFKKENTWRQLEGLCLIIKINIYMETQLF